MQDLKRHAWAAIRHVQSHKLEETYDRVETESEYSYCFNIICMLSIFCIMLSIYFNFVINVSLTCGVHIYFIAGAALDYHTVQQLVLYIGDHAGLWFLAFKILMLCNTSFCSKLDLEFILASECTSTYRSTSFHYFTSESNMVSCLKICSPQQSNLKCVRHTCTSMCISPSLQFYFR